MDLRLIFRGDLPTNEDKAVETKHGIRRQLRMQIFDHVRRRPALADLTEQIRGHASAVGPPDGSSEPDWASIGRKYRFRDQEFVPLVVGAAHAICHLNILFLRREQTETLISKPKDEYGGDLDNRLKIYLDGLRVPQVEKEVPAHTKYEPWEIGHPFYCLLEDDSLITKLSIEVDILPGLYHPEEQKQVMIITTATIKLTSVTHYNYLLASVT